jgi:5-(carboxyamino)imidazole ribonucleotide mutase
MPQCGNAAMPQSGCLNRPIRNHSNESLNRQSAIGNRQWTPAIYCAPMPSSPLVAVIMGSTSDWDTMTHAAQVLERFGVPYEKAVVSAHRTPVWMAEFAQGAEARGVQVIIAGAGGAAHLPGMVAAHTVLPVLGVPVQSAALQGLDSLLSIVQMPGGVPVGTLAIGQAGATNAGLLAVAILSTSRPDLREQLRAFREDQTSQVRAAELP